METKSLYDRIGGQSGIDSIVEELYTRVTTDSVLGSYFRNVSVDRLKVMQRHFLAAATGGPMNYSGRPLSVVHKPLGISRYEFNRYVQLMVESLSKLGVSEEDSQQAVATINIYAGDIVNDLE